MLKRVFLMLTTLYTIHSVWAIEAMQSLPPLGFSETQPVPGQFIYIDIWASWCGPCRQSFPWMNTLQAKYASSGLKVVAINVDSKHEAAVRFLTHTPAQFTVVFDEQGNSAKRLSIKTMPTSLLVNPEGKIVWIHSGFRAEDTSQLEARIAKALRRNQH